MSICILKIILQNVMVLPSSTPTPTLVRAEFIQLAANAASQSATNPTRKV